MGPIIISLIGNNSVLVCSVSFPFLSLCCILFRFASLPSASTRFVSLCFVSFPFASFRFVLFRFALLCSLLFRFVSFDFISLCFVSFWFVSFRLILFCFVPFRENLTGLSRRNRTIFHFITSYKT